MLAALRHSELASLPDRIQKQALVRLTGHDSGPSSPAFQNALFGVQPQPAHLLVGMATEALLRKKWTNACFEELNLSRSIRSDQHQQEDTSRGAAEGRQSAWNLSPLRGSDLHCDANPGLTPGATL